MSVGRKAARALAEAGKQALRHMPQLRRAVRHATWTAQGKRYEKLASSIAVDADTVLFESYGGRSYACSPRAIYEEMKADPRFSGKRFVWSFVDGRVPDDASPADESTHAGEGPSAGEGTHANQNPSSLPTLSEDPLAGAHIVEYGSQEYLCEIARAGIIVMNNRLPEYVQLKEGQRYVQCWHGTPLKRLGYDVERLDGAMNTADELAERFGIDARKWTYLVSPSPFTSEHLCDAFGVPKERRAATVLEVGYPRNDRLVRQRDNASERARILAANGVDPAKKTILYAPTFRDDQYDSALGYTFDQMIDFEALRRHLGDEWVVLFRPHYYIASTFDFEAHGGFVVNASAGDVSDWFLAADVLVTDYSSVFFDYANLRRPMLFFVPDLEHYANDLRGFYFDIHEVPGPLCRETAEIIAHVQELDSYEALYGAAYDAFAARFCPLDDGHAAARVVDALEK